jgi:hypothetical protein
MTEEVIVIKRFKPFVLGFCRCNCGKEIKIITSTWEKGLGHWLQTYKSGHNPIDYSKANFPTRDKHHNYKGGIKKMVGEYLGILRPHHKYAHPNGYVLLHRYRMELMLGRYLDPKEVVHHIDGDPTNNEEFNLMLFASNGEHITFEHTIDMSDRICSLCGLNKTRIRIKNGKKYVEWRTDKITGKFLCSKCYRTTDDYKKRKKIIAARYWKKKKAISPPA